jgi:hypothetical protein
LGKEYNQINLIKRHLQGFAIKLRTNTLLTIAFLKKTIGIKNERCPYCRNRQAIDTWEHWTRQHLTILLEEMKETIVQKMGTDITIIDIKMNTNLDKWYKIVETGVIDEETAKKLFKNIGDKKRNKQCKERSNEEKEKKKRKKRRTRKPRNRHKIKRTSRRIRSK